MEADVIVIGAGAAGLSAARSLAARSLRVVLVEARDRIGGRVWSRPGPRAVTPAELGAEFIHGRALLTQALLRDAGSAAIDLGGEAWMRRDGELRTDEDDFIEAAGIFEGSRSLAHDESVEAFLQRFAGDDTQRRKAQNARAFVEGFEAADPAIASAQAIAAEWRSGVDSVSARPLGGYPPIFERLNGGCAAGGVRLSLSTVVQRIAWRRGEVSIDVVDAADELATLHAKTAIVTLPVGVLRYTGDERAIAFDPPLPAPKRAALEKLEMGEVVRVVLWFRTAFWERIAGGRYRDAAFFHDDDGPIAAYWTQLPVRSESVVAWAGGPRARALRKADVGERIDRALGGFGTLLGEPELARHEFEAALTHDWSADPFARGAYSYVTVGGDSARADLAAPLDETLFFAGEATSTDGQGGTVNGALETGERAAREAAQALGAR